MIFYEVGFNSLFMCIYYNVKGCLAHDLCFVFVFLFCVFFISFQNVPTKACGSPGRNCPLPSLTSIFAPSPTGFKDFQAIYGATTPQCPTSISISFISFHRAERISLQAFKDCSTCIVYKKDPLPRVNSLLEIKIHKM